MKSRTYIYAFFLVVAIVGAISPFAFRDQSEGNNPTKLRIGYIPIADCGQLYVALEKGFFAEEGIEIETVPLAGGAKVLEALGAKSIDVGFSNIVSLILAYNAGLPFVAITGGPIENAGHKEHAILVSRTSTIKNIRDLRGKKIAINTRKNIDELMVSALLQKHGIGRESVLFIEVPFPRMVSVLEGGDVDGIAAIEPYVTFGLSAGTNKVLTYNYVDIQPVTEISSYVVSKSWLASHPRTATAFKNALKKATVYANSHPNEVRTLLTKFTHLTEEQLRGVALPGFTLELSPELLQQMITRVADLGWIDATFPAENLIR